MLKCCFLRKLRGGRHSGRRTQRWDIKKSVNKEMGNELNYENSLNNPISKQNYSANAQHPLLPELRVLLLQMLLILFDRGEPSHAPTHLANDFILLSIHQALHSPLR